MNRHISTGNENGNRLDEEEANRYRAPALDKGLDILELLAGQAEGMTRADIEKALGRGSSEIYRMLERLVARQYVQRDGDRHVLSLKLFSLAHLHPPIGRLITLARPVMDVFSRQAEQSCHIGVYDRGNVLVVAQVPGPGVWGLSIRLGATLSLLDTSSGHVLLACQDKDRCHAMLAEATSSTNPADISTLSRILAAIRKRGYKQVASRQSWGVVDIACPIKGVDGHALAVMTTPYIRHLDQPAGPSPDEVRALLQQAAASLSVRLQSG